MFNPLALSAGIKHVLVNGTFVVRDEHLSEVRGLLERLGFTIGDSLDPPPLGGLENPAKDSPAAVDRTNSIAKRPARTIMAAG